MNQQIQVPNIQELAVQKEQQAAMLHAEVRRISAGIYERLVSKYLSTLVVGEIPSPASLEHFAKIAVKSAPYHHQACGLVNINEQEHWK